MNKPIELGSVLEQTKVANGIKKEFVGGVPPCNPSGSESDLSNDPGC